MMASLTALLDRLLSQDVARSNAAREAIRLQNSRRRLDDVNAFLAAHHESAQRHAAATAAHTSRGRRVEP